MAEHSARRLTYAANAMMYVAMPLLRNAVTFLTLPIMTRYLAPSDYGVVNMIAMLVGLGGLFVFGLNTSCCRYYFIYSDDPDKLKRLYSTNLNFIFLSMSVYGVVLAGLSVFLSEKLFANKVVMVWIVAAAFQSLCANVNAVTQNFLQNRHQGRFWFVNEAGALIVQTGVMLSMVFFRIGTFEAILMSGILAEGTKSLLSLRHLRPYYAPIFDRRIFAESFRYAWPSIPTSLISYVYGYFDKLLVNRAFGLGSVGILDISSKFSNVLKMLMDGVDGVVSPVNMGLISSGKEADLKRLADFNMKVIFSMLLIALGLIFMVREVVFLLTTPAYSFVAYVAPLYVFYHAFGILSFPSFWAIYHRTDLAYVKIISNSIFLGLSLGLNIILIPKYGVLGAGIAIAVSAMVTQIVQLVIGLRVTPIPLPIGKLVALFLMLLAGTAISYLLSYYRASYPIDIFVKLILCVCYTAAGFGMGVVDRADISEAVSLVRTKLRAKFKPECRPE